MGRITEKSLKKEMTDYLCDLVSCNTTNPPGNEYLCLPILRKMMGDIGMKITIKEKVKNRTNVIGSIGKGKPVVVIVGHMDVVPGGTGWTKTKPFSPKVIGSKIYGRGAEDNKGGFVASWAGIKLFLERHPTFIGTLNLIAIADEEVGNEFGATFLLSDGYKADYGLIPDAGPMNELIIGEKGVLWLRIKSIGKQAHGSLPHKGINAIENLMELLLELKKTDWGKSTSLDFKPTTYNLGVLNAGEAPNMVPGEALAEVDFRRPVGVSKKNILDKIDNAILKVKKTNPTVKFTVEVTQETEPHVVNQTNKVVTAFIGAAKEKGIDIKAKTIGGNTIGKPFCLANIPSVVHYPSMDETAHMADEHVDINELYQGARLYALFLENLLIKSSL